MANISKQKRDRMLAFLEELKKTHSDDASIRAFNEIENHLREKKYGLVWEEHEEENENEPLEAVTFSSMDFKMNSRIFLSSSSYSTSSISFSSSSSSAHRARCNSAQRQLMTSAAPPAGSPGYRPPARPQSSAGYTAADALRVRR